MSATPDPDSALILEGAAGSSLGAAAALGGIESTTVVEAPLRAAWRAFCENRLALLGASMLTVIILFCFVGPLVYHTDQLHVNLNNQNLHPSLANHFLGTDDLGHDVLGRLMVGGQSTLEVAFGAAVLAIVLGAFLGAVSGVLGGIVDALLMRVVDTLNALPWLVLLLFVGAITRPDKLLLIALLGLFAWIGPARFVRGEALSLREREYVQAVRLMGGSRLRIVMRHIIPNTIGTITVNATFQIADAILAIATLSFLGLGLPPPTATWGGMLSNGLNYAFSGYWWDIYPAGVAILITVIAFNLIGDGLRDALEVRLRD